MLELTVVFVSLAFRPNDPFAQPREVWTGYPGGPSAPQDGRNDIPPVGAGGEPLLGAIAPGFPPTATGFFKNIEISASVSPCINSLGSVADFKRLRQGFDGVVATINGQAQFLVNSGETTHCPPPAWCDDDVNNGQVFNDDEDLAFDAPPACTVFVIDGPGLDIGGPCTQAQIDAGAQPVHCMNFVEWFNLDGFRASATLNWSTATAVSCGPNGQWVEGNAWSTNRVGPSHKPFPALPPTVLVQPVQAGIGTDASIPTAGVNAPTLRPEGEQADSRIVWDRVREAIIHAGTQDMGVQVDSFRATYAAMESGLRGDEVNEALRWLDTFLRKSDHPNIAGTFFDQRLLAIWVLGELGDVEAARLLIPYVNTRFAGGGGRMSRMFTPGVRALARCGENAVGPILERCRMASSNEWDKFTLALRQIDKDSPLVRQAMRAVLDAQAVAERDELAGLRPRPDEAEKARRALMKQRLREFLFTPEPERPKPIIAALQR